MALENVHTLLRMADGRRTAVLAFICLDYNMVYSVIRGAEKTRRPVIIMLLPEHATIYGTTGFKAFAAMVKAMAEEADVPVGLHLDHSYLEEEIYQAIDAGFTSVMFDASREELERNILRTKKVVDYAHSRGVSVEAELGSIGSAAERENEKRNLFTDPELAAMFCQETGVDALAVAIGNAHGDYPYPPRLDLERLDEINRKTDAPLVLHGGSGIPDSQLGEAFFRGINKFNYGTDVLRCYDQAIRGYHQKCRPSKSLDILGLPAYVQDSITALVERKIQLCRLVL